jgi:hypothetical protein
MAEKVSPMLFERYEMKYFITPKMRDEISSYIECYCDLDPYSERVPGHYYRINNLYFDTPNNLFLERRLAGIDHRFNMRIRSYGDEPHPPYLFEIKRKGHGVVKKTRAKVFSEDWARPLIERPSNDELPQIVDLNSDYYQQFLALVHSYDATPKVFTHYLRKAYVSNIDDYARITFDKNLRYMEQTKYTLSPEEDKMINYDFSDVLGGDDRTIILELKCNVAVPKWFIDIITHFNLERTGCSKYVKGINAYTREYDPVSYAGEVYSSFAH